ncbi:MAG: dicarboxylate/amino acid:cation symporter [Phycisphaeraceae bacterium]
MAGDQTKDVTTDTPRGFAPWRWPLHVQILLGLIVGVALGVVSGMSAVASAQPIDASAADVIAKRLDYLAYDLIGDLFIQGLKLIIVPIVVSSIVLAVAGIGDRAGFGRLGAKTLGYYLSTSMLAILIGLTLVNLVSPGTAKSGSGILQGQTDFTAFEGESGEIAGRSEGRDATSFLDVFRKMVPENLAEAAGDNGQLLGLIVVAMVLGYMVVRIPSDLRDVLLSFTQAVYELTLKVTDLVLRLAPIGVCFLVASAFAMQYAKLVPEDRLGDLAGGIAWFAGVALAALLIHLLVVMPLILCLIARVNPLRHYRAMMPALLTAFSTASSSGTLPVTMDCVEERAGVSNKTTSFVLPLGATVNMDGTALYECVAAIFICQAFGVELSFSQQFFIVMVALLTSVGVAGVPSASIVAIVVILQAVSAQVPAEAGLPEGGLVAGLFLIWLVDRPLDMVRTAVNVFSDSVGAVVIARSEGEVGVLSSK